MAEPDTWIEITDFTPGIWGDMHATGNTVASSTQLSTLRGTATAGNGAATVENTFDCTADKTGALIPLPKKTVGRTQAVLPGGNTNAGNTNFMPTNYGASYLLDAQIVQRSFTTADPTGGDRVNTLWSFRYSPAGNSTYSQFIQGRQYRNYGATSFYDFLWYKETYTWPGLFPSGSMTQARLGPLTS